MPTKKYVDHYDSAHNPLRHGTYAAKPVKCPNAKPFGFDKTEASAGDIIEYCLEGRDDVKFYRTGRVMGRVDAPALKGSLPSYDAPEIKGFIAVMELYMLDGASVRWIDPKDVTRVRNCPKHFPAWFFQEEMPDFEEVLRLNRLGALSDSYIAKYAKSSQYGKEKK